MQNECATVQSLFLALAASKAGLGNIMKHHMFASDSWTVFLLSSPTSTSNQATRKGASDRARASAGSTAALRLACLAHAMATLKRFSPSKRGTVTNPPTHTVAQVLTSTFLNVSITRPLENSCTSCCICFSASPIGTCSRLLRAPREWDRSTCTSMLRSTPGQKKPCWHHVCLELWC